MISVGAEGERRVEGDSYVPGLGNCETGMDGGRTSFLNKDKKCLIWDLLKLSYLCDILVQKASSWFEVQVCSQEKYQN